MQEADQLFIGFNCWIVLLTLVQVQVSCPAQDGLLSTIL